MEKVRNIVFDFGNVLLNLDMSATEKRMNALIGDKYGFSAEKNAYPAFFEEYEVGKISEEDFLHGLRKMTNDTAQESELKSAWNAMLLDLPAERLEMLLLLRKKYRVFLLSNTNKTHIDFVMRYLLHTYGIDDWDTRYFEKTYYSHLVGLRKPDAEIYNFVAKDAAISPAETLFIDDNSANIATANALGWQTVLHNTDEDIVKVLQNY